MKNHMAIDQYGETYHGLGAYPRKELMERLDRKHAAKMYIGHEEMFHVGYVIAGRWLNIYEVTPMRKKA